MNPLWKSVLLLWRPILCVAGVPCLLGAIAPAARAQADYRNLDAGRPLAVEDAQPVEFRAMELSWLLPRFTRERAGSWLFGMETEYKWGILPDAQIGITTDFATVREAGRTISGLRDVQLHALYNFNQETHRVPAFAIRPELTLPAGGLGTRNTYAALKVILSKTFSRNRIHLNGSYAVGPTEIPGRSGDLVSRHFYGVAYERTLPLKFLVLLADVYARKPIDHAPTEVVFDLGVRLQLNPAWVLDAGINSGALRHSAGHDFGFTFGLSRAFSFRSLFPIQGRKP